MFETETRRLKKRKQMLGRLQSFQTKGARWTKRATSRFVTRDTSWLAAASGRTDPSLAFRIDNCGVHNWCAFYANRPDTFLKFGRGVDMKEHLIYGFAK
jgi:hypothetical protein